MMLAMLACLAVNGERVLARDFGAAWPAMAALGETPAGFAPAPGARRVFHAPELARVAARHGIQPPAGEICFERTLRRLSPEDVLPAMRAVFPEARITVREVSRYPAPAGGIVFPREALRPDGMWRGWIRYAGNLRFLVWARVEVRTTLRRVRALEALKPGAPVSPSQVRVETLELPPGGSEYATDVAQVSGRKPRRTIPAGSWVPLAMLQEPNDVEPGEMVAVRVESGAARLAFEGRAETGGRRGDTVRVRNPETKRVFAARVENKAAVVVKTR